MGIAVAPNWGDQGVIGESVLRGSFSSQESILHRGKGHPMRKLFVLIVTGTIALGISLPASAATRSKPASYSSSARSADAFWTTTRALSATTYRQTVWYIGVYQSSDYTYSDAYKTVVDCTKELGEDYDECTLVSYAYGDSNLDGQTFTFGKRLSAAHLEATYAMNTYDGKRGDSGRSFSIDVIVDWTGAGQLQRSHGTSTYRSGCYLVHESSRGAWRDATATGSINGRARGTTDVASLSKYASRYLEKIC
jgi:hypothetical protein